MRFQRFLIAAVLSFGALAASAAPTHAVMIYANGGRYFTASGPTYYWHYDANEGYCGHMAGWCSPANFQWTYSMYPQYSTNYAVWKTEPAQQYFSRAYAFVPRKDATAAAFYTVQYEVGSRSTYMVNQMAYSDQWAQLGGNHYLVSAVSLSDNNQWWGGNGKYRVAFDEIKIEN